METVRPMSILPAIKPQQESNVGPGPRRAYTPRQAQPAASRSDSVPPPQARKQSLGVGGAIGHQPKPPRTAPPRIDPTAANQPYIQRDGLAPGGQWNSASRPPPTPLTGTKPPRSPMMRSMTSPMPRIYRPPSMELSSNLDCAFPPFPTSRPSTTSSSKARSVSSSGQGAGARTPTSPPLHAEPESYCGPRSPRTTGGANVLQRMNTIAPGPFNTKRRKDSSDALGKGQGVSSPVLQTQGLQATSSHETVQPHVADQNAQQRPTTSRQTSPTVAHTPNFTAISPPKNREGKRVPQRPIRPEPLDGFLALLKDGSAEAKEQVSVARSLESRSNTFPLSNDGGNEQDSRAPNFSRRPSEPSLRPRRPTLTASANTDPEIHTSPKLSVDVPPVPLLSSMQPPPQPQPYPVHAPSDSASSTSSTRSYGGSSFKSDLSPPVSASSSVSMLSALGDTLKDQDSTLLVPSLQIRNKLSQSRLRHGEDSQSSSPLSSENNSPQLLSDAIFSKLTEKSPVVVMASPPLTQHSISPESPVIPTGQEFGKPAARQPSGKRPGTATKHHCRGCAEPITGKSVKAADGRLTGRYHKNCFVCKTCHSPFATADFYVINNDPYCEHHYHKLNNSLCANCDHGIEGPYLETQQGPKFHPQCFTCLDCHKVLSDDYFEISGKVYCEQHAFTALRRQEGLGPKRNMERRTTRFMMM
ncbi:hypothetical protein MBLNU459_g1026t2 [Dothideomycetes sp. NU459]